MRNMISNFSKHSLKGCPKIKIILPCILLALLIGCSQMKPVRQDPLIGKIYSSHTKQEITYQELLDDVIKAEVIYLGENHENADHHRHQMQIIEDLIKQGKKPVIGFEFFSVDQTGHLMAYVSSQSAKHPKFVDDKREAILRNDLGWLSRADTTWQFYFQFVKLAAENKLTVFGADLPTGIVRRITRNGIEALTEIEKAFLRTTPFENEAYRQLMHERFKAAHCGYAHQKMMERMYDTWLARNDTMAHSIATMRKSNPDQPVVMILGKGHTENNMAVYDRVAHRIPNIKQLNLGFTEIAINPTPLESYFSAPKIVNKTFPSSFEFLWFTQRTSYEDPCERFREQLKRMKKSHKAK